MDTPNELLHLDMWHKASTGKRVQVMSHGRFGMLPREFYLKEAIDRYNRYQPSRLFLDPYHVADGNLWSAHVADKVYQRGQALTSKQGSTTCKELNIQKESKRVPDPHARERSIYLEPPRGRFVPPLKPKCARDKGPDPYGVGKQTPWVIRNVGFSPSDARGVSSDGLLRPSWTTFSLSRRTMAL